MAPRFAIETPAPAPNHVLGVWLRGCARFGPEAGASAVSLHSSESTAVRRSSLTGESLIGVFPWTMHAERPTRLEANPSARLIFRGTRARVFHSILGPHGWDEKEKK